ncbi:MAG TPA: glycosyltransferase family 2 protein [Acidimicrobiia bacterium]|nr:glycosyltransferase family 2 protein [Acidimicrobiia bacterium]
MPSSPGSEVAGATVKWSAVVVNHNAGDLLLESVRSLVDDGAHEVVVVDNASSDGSVDALEAVANAHDLPVAVVRAEANAGYAAGANLGIGHTDTEVVAVLNPDTRVSSGTGFALAAVFDDPSVAAAGPRVLNPDGTTYPSARSVPSTLDAIGHGAFGLVWAGNPFTRRYRQTDVDPGVRRNVDWVSGAAMWLRRSALDEIGGWDEGYFMYVEDVDVCWRLRQAGWRIVYEPAGRVEHVQGTSTAQRPYRMLAAHHRSLLRFAAKRWRGFRRVLLVPAAGYLTLRALAAMAAHALRARSQAPRA